MLYSKPCGVYVYKLSLSSSLAFYSLFENNGLSFAVK